MNPMLESFISESRDNLEEASQCFLALERAPDNANTMQTLFRAMHTIKGSSGLFDLGPFTRLMHVAEDILDLARSGELHLESEHIDVLLNAMDQITLWIDELEKMGQLGSDAESCATPHIAALKAIIPTLDGQQTDASFEQPIHEGLPKKSYSFDEVHSILSLFSNQERTAVFEQSDLVTLIKYHPKQECFFTGDDPLHTALLTPEFLAIKMATVNAWPEIDQFDPYQCNLDFFILSGADQELLLDHFKYVEDEIELIELIPTWLAFPTGEQSEDKSLFEDIAQPLEDCLLQQQWNRAEQLISPVIELANPDGFDWACLRWIQLLIQSTSLESLHLKRLHQALVTGTFPFESMTDIEASEIANISPQLSVQENKKDLNEAQKTLLQTQLQMLRFAKESDLEGRLATVLTVIKSVMNDADVTQQAQLALDEALESRSAFPLSQYIEKLLDDTFESENTASTQNDTLTQNVDLPQETTSQTLMIEEPLVDEPDDKLDLASMVKAELNWREHQPVEKADTPVDIRSDEEDSSNTEVISSLSNTITTPMQEVAQTVKSPATKPEPTQGSKAQVLKVDQHRIDTLMDLVGELVVAKNSLPYLAKRAEEDFHVRALSKEIKNQYAVINRLAEAMQSTMMQIRMVPVSTIFQRFPRLVRDLSRKLNKDVRLILEGEESEADKNVVENLADPLIHLVRNSLDHGFETEQERLEQGKPAHGTLYLRAIPKDDQVIIEVVDDGRGMDPQRLKQVAYRKGIINEQRLETITDQEVLYLIFAPGFSTAPQVSDLSGRGVGMDVVNGLVQQAGGKVTIDSEIGKGTTIRMFLPLTMAVSRVMMVEVRGQCFGISMESIVETVKIPHERLSRIKQGEAIVLRDKVIPVISLHRLLALPETDFSEDVPLLIMNLNGEDVALKIDQFHEGIDIVQKPLAGLMSQYNYYSGSALLGDGRVLLILNIKELLSCQ